MSVQLQPPVFVQLLLELLPLMLAQLVLAQPQLLVLVQGLVLSLTQSILPVTSWHHHCRGMHDGRWWWGLISLAQVEWGLFHVG